MRFTHRTLLLALLGLASDAVASTCRAVPGSPKWPSPDVWSAFNDTLGGRLLDPTPPGAVCHPERKEFNADVCKNVTQAWSGSAFHAYDPPVTTSNSLKCELTFIGTILYQRTGTNGLMTLASRTPSSHAVTAATRSLL